MAGAHMSRHCKGVGEHLEVDLEALLQQWSGLTGCQALACYFHSLLHECILKAQTGIGNEGQCR